MATHSIVAWRIPWTEEPGRLQFMGLHKVRHDYSTNTLLLYKEWKFSSFKNVIKLASTTFLLSSEMLLSKHLHCKNYMWTPWRKVQVVIWKIVRFLCLQRKHQAESCSHWALGPLCAVENVGQKIRKVFLTKIKQHNHIALFKSNQLMSMTKPLVTLIVYGVHALQWEVHSQHDPNTTWVL